MVLLLGALLLELPLALSATLALVKRVAGRITSPVAHVATMELRAARVRALAIAATGAVAVFGSVAIQGAHGDLLSGPGRGGARHERVHRRLGGAGGLVQPAADGAVSADAAGTPAASAGGAHGGALPQRAARLRRAPRAGDRPAARSDAAGARQPDRAGQRGPGDRAGARRRLGGALAGARRRTASAHRAGVHAAEPRPAEVPRRRALDQPRLGAGRDLDERLRLCARVGQRRRDRLRHHTRPRRHAERGRP